MQFKEVESEEFLTRTVELPEEEKTVEFTADFITDLCNKARAIGRKPLVWIVHGSDSWAMMPTEDYEGLLRDQKPKE